MYTTYVIIALLYLAIGLLSMGDGCFKSSPGEMRLSNIRWPWFMAWLLFWPVFPIVIAVLVILVCLIWLGIIFYKFIKVRVRAFRRDRCQTPL